MTGLPFLQEKELQDPGKALEFLPFHEILKVLIKRTDLTQSDKYDTFHETSREPTPAAWDSS